MITVTYNDAGEYKLKFYLPSTTVKGIYCVETLEEAASLIGHYYQQPHDETTCPKCKQEREVSCQSH